MNPLMTLSLVRTEETLAAISAREASCAMSSLMLTKVFLQDVRFGTNVALKRPERGLDFSLFQIFRCRSCCYFLSPQGMDTPLMLSEMTFPPE